MSTQRRGSWLNQRTLLHSYNVSEKASTVSVTVRRSGNLNQYAIVLCRTEPGSATSSSSPGQRPGQLDYVEYAGQVTMTTMTVP